MFGVSHLLPSRGRPQNSSEPVELHPYIWSELQSFTAASWPPPPTFTSSEPTDHLYLPNSLLSTHLPLSCLSASHTEAFRDVRKGRLYLQDGDLHRVVDGQRPLQDGSGHDRPLTADGEAVVHRHQQVPRGVSLWEVRLLFQQLGGKTERCEWTGNKTKNTFRIGSIITADLV